MAEVVSSPILSSNDSETTSVGAAAHSPSPAPTSVPSILLQRSEATTKNLRGLNKPKCSTCGNVARSRCPFQCCKSCCSKAQNPCHIHVLKPNATLADRGSSANSAPPQQQQSEVAPPGPSAKGTSVRQLSSTFSQFSNLHIPLRSRKPLSRAEALLINEWRFAKLKEYKENNIEAENEAFDRYMQNISLLKQVFDLYSDRAEDDGTQLSEPPMTSGENTRRVSEIKAKIRSNPLEIDTFRKRIRQTVDQGLRNLQMYKSNRSSGNLDKKYGWVGKTSAWAELNDKLNSSQNEEDLKLCMRIRTKIKGCAKSTSYKKPESTELSKNRSIPDDISFGRGSGNSLLCPVRATQIDQNVLNGMEFHFSSLEEIEDL
ncbi:uncharacterized protein LOC141653699 [Silene latifolia]|uniref:uncharacterized protein LOC141653699 n=1 Tax=Silene latifolia TaxID=37657 RepID=UPI003D77BCA9